MPSAVPSLSVVVRRWRAAVIAVTALAAAAGLDVYVQLSTRATVDAGPAAPSLYDVAAPDLRGTRVALADYRGQVLLVVNVASECGLASQYEGLEALYQQYRPQGFAVLAFPSNDFWQEPGGAVEIAQACALHGVSFPVFAKIGVRPGVGQSPIYALLTGTGHVPLWNFAKYLVGRDGRVRHFFGSLVAPDAPELREAIRAALAAPGGPAHVEATPSP